MDIQAMLKAARENTANLQAAAQKAAAPKEQPQEKPRYALVGGKWVEKRPELPDEEGIHAVGAPCPHCRGGRYRWHTQNRTEKCYRCDGKGILDARDLQFYENRIKKAQPLCTIKSA